MKQPTKRKRIEFSIGPVQQKELEYLMGIWHLNRSNMLRIAISIAAKEMKRQDREGAA